MTKVIDIQQTWRDDPATPDEVLGKLQALDWQITEQKPDRYVLQHDLIPGASRIVLRL